LRNFKGIQRKSSLGEILSIFNEKTFDDAGFFDVNNFKVVVSCDGIEENLVKNDPRLAGYFSVLVNVNDVIAKGAKPIGFVNIISSSSITRRRKIAQGIQEGLKKYRLKLLKGHTHPDTSFDAVDGAVVGITKNVVQSSTGRIGDALVVAVDLSGKLCTEGWIKFFDSTTTKSSEDVLKRLESMIKLAERKWVNSARDISGPGIIGTLSMLCESSQIGASVNLESIPKPRGVNLEDWLTVYPGIGFIISTSHPRECLDLLESHALSAAVIGNTISQKEIWLSFKDVHELYMDLRYESIFGLRRSRNRNFSP
jgi:selenophosphate synthetase-related protein